MSEPISAADALKNTFKEPLFYVIAVFVSAGTWLIKDITTINATWILGLCMIIFAGIAFVVQVINALVDNSFTRRYKEVLVAQTNLISKQQETIATLSRTSIAAHDTMTKGADVIGDYTKVAPSETSTI